MKLSIITINLNNASGLQRTIKSVVSQTSSEFEYIIIDGCSTDGSLEIIRSFTHIPQDVYYPLNVNDRPHSPITYWISEPDKGIFNAMNKGILKAKGEYCQFLNSGDWLVGPDVTSLMLTNLPDCSIVYGNMIKQMPNGRILHNKEIPVNSFLTFYTGSLNHSPEYIKRSLFDKYGLYDESLKIVSDWKFNLIAIILHNETVSYRDIDLSCFNMKGISNTNKELNRLERRLVLEQLLPPKILSDYDLYARLILQMKRINRFKLTRWVVWLIDRFLFKTEKWETRIKEEHIQY